MKLLLISLSLIISIICAEIVLRFLGNVRNVGPSFTEFDPIYGKTLKRNLHVVRESPEFEMIITTNSLGFRGIEPKEMDQGSILFLGDSFTMGYGVSDGEEFPALVRAGVEVMEDSGTPSVINAGISGSGNGRWIKFLRNELESLKPHLVVLQFLNNDFDDNIEENLFTIDVNGELKELPIVKPNMRFAQEVLDAVPLLDHSHLYGFLKEQFWFGWWRESKHNVKKIEEEESRDKLTRGVSHRLWRCD
jgi:hypothetical protein